jgi:hypothetical protein
MRIVISIKTSGLNFTLKYERESANRTQMAIKSKTSEIEIWKKHLFLYMSSTNNDTLVASYSFSPSYYIRLNN